MYYGWQMFVSLFQLSASAEIEFIYAGKKFGIRARAGKTFSRWVRELKTLKMFTRLLNLFPLLFPKNM